MDRRRIKQSKPGLGTNVHYKSIDPHGYLRYSSSHPSLVKNSIPNSQFLRLSLLCSEDSDFSLKSEEAVEHERSVGENTRRSRVFFPTS